MRWLIGGAGLSLAGQVLHSYRQDPSTVEAVCTELSDKAAI